jgi:hypothetical protein
MLENWLLPQLNTNYDDYILQLDGVPPIFTGMYECFSIVFFNIAGSDVLQQETTTCVAVHQLLQHFHTEMLQYVQLYSMRALCML